MLLLIALLCFVVSALFALAEAVMNRDWPRDTFKYVVIFGIILVLAVSA